MEETKDKIWSAIGKIAAVITAFGVLVTIYIQFKGMTKGDAEGVYYPYETVPEYLLDTTSKQFKSDKYNSFYEVTITNNGDNPLEDLIFESPLKGFYKIIYPDSTVSKPFNVRFSLGNLRASYEIKVLCWSESLPSSKLFDNIRVTHKNGSFEVAKRITYRVADFFSLFMVILLFAETVVFRNVSLKIQQDMLKKN